MSYAYPTGFASWGGAEHDAIQRVLASGRFTIGDEVVAFEREFAAFHGKKHCVMVNSGSSANLLMIAALCYKSVLPLRPGDQVVVPALAWSTTYAPLVQYGLKIVLADATAATWNAAPMGEPEKTKLIVGCSVLGIPAPLNLLKAHADEIEAYFVEDNCETFNGECGGTKCGAFGLMASFSFFYSHQLSAIEGGAIVTDDDEMNARLRILRAHGWTRDVETPATFADEYKFVAFGFNVRPIELHAAIARVQLAKAQALRDGRYRNWGYWAATTADLPITRPTVPHDVVPNFFGLHFLVADGATRQRAVTALRAGGIDCRLPTGGSFHLHPYGAAYLDQATPVADDIHTRGLFLGNSADDLTSLIDRAAAILRETL